MRVVSAVTSIAMRTMPVMPWIRARQRDLTKVVLALFCLAWLQAAAMPCAMAGAAASVPAEHCLYCPPPGPDASPAHDNCVYPHEPQLDSRIAAGLYFVVPVTVVIATLDLPPAETAAASPEQPPPDAGAPLLASYCRYLL